MERKLKILVVGDRPSQRDGLGLALGALELAPRVSSSFELAFAAAQEQPDLVVLDAESLRIEEVVQAIKDGSVTCPWVVVADPPSRELGAIAARLGATGYLEHAGSPADLAAKLTRFVSRAEEPSVPPRERVDFVGTARRSTRAEFVAKWPCPFLVSAASLVSQAQARRTADMLDPEVLQAIEDAIREKEKTKASGRGYVDTPRRSSATALAIRSLGGVEKDAITVGRGADVDVFVDHATISKHHASFVRAAAGFRVADAGSRNGTWVSGIWLEPNGELSPILESGDAVRLGELEFNYLSAPAAWDVLRVNVR
jgi:DNA-binding response OmpR family regulator